MTAPVVPLERGYCHDSAEPILVNMSSSQKPISFTSCIDIISIQIAQCPKRVKTTAYHTRYTFIYMYAQHITLPEFQRPLLDISTSTSRRPTTRHTARSAAVRHTSWLCPLRPFP